MGEGRVRALLSDLQDVIKGSPHPGPLPADRERVTQMIRKSSTIAQRRCRVKVSGLVTPSPVGVAML